ncbi:MAG: M50 family metallopeptidase [Myxococcota bacterium]
MPPSSTLDAKKLTALVVALALGVALWDSPVLWPLKILVVAFHETGHAVASLWVGGSVEHITLRPNESGECLSSLPSGFFAKVAVYSGGYLGSALTGALLLLFTFRLRLRRIVLGAMSAWLVVIAFFYARDGFTLLFCLGTAGVLGTGARVLPLAAVEVLNLFLAAFSSLYAVMDLKDDLWDGSARAHTDAQLLANVTFVPSLVWAAVWTLFALAVLSTAGWWSVRGRRPLPAPPP